MSDVGGAYDPNAVEGDKSAGGQYVTKKDLKVWGIGLVVLGLFSYPVFQYLQNQSERARCGTNFRAVYQAISLYAEQHDYRFPPLARTEGNGVTPSLSDTGHPYTWISDVAPFMNARQSFLCPAASEAERVQNESPVSATATIPSAYGMYVPYGGVLTSIVENPDEVVLIADTSNRRGQETLDPLPYGKGLPDGFAIGWSNSNVMPDKETKSVTRLAFPRSGLGPTDAGRHGKFIWAMSASGELLQIHPDDAIYNTGISGVNSHWRLPPGYRGPER